MLLGPQKRSESEPETLKRPPNASPKTNLEKRCLTARAHYQRLLRIMSKKAQGRAVCQRKSLHLAPYILKNQLAGTESENTCTQYFKRRSRKAKRTQRRSLKEPPKEARNERPGSKSSLLSGFLEQTHTKMTKTCS